uniref:Putative RNA-directed DNA polymerase n=1 Tax=Schizaphis graminum TaxID=13262 RepID=A0A2S2PK46_SCHGA
MLIIQAFQSITLRIITSTPCFVLNKTLHSYLKIESFIDKLATKHLRSFYSKLHYHTNPLVSQILLSTQPINSIHRLKRKYCRDLRTIIKNFFEIIIKFRRYNNILN